MVISVLPITKGYPFTFSLQFMSAGGTAIFLAPNPIPSRIRGEFRYSPDPSYPVLGHVDTTDGTLTINNDGSLTMSMPEAMTAGFPAGTVFLDFARVDGGITTPVGVQFQWPVVAPVTAVLT